MWHSKHTYHFNRSRGTFEGVDSYLSRTCDTKNQGIAGAWVAPLTLYTLKKTKNKTQVEVTSSSTVTV